MSTPFDDTLDIQQYVRGTPFAVYAGQARRNMRTMSNSSQPPIATPLSQTASLPESGYQYEPRQQHADSNFTLHQYPAPIANSSYPQGDYWSGAYMPTVSVSSEPSSSMIPAWISTTSQSQPVWTPASECYSPFPIINNGFDNGIAPAPTGTVQPSAIFGVPTSKETSVPQTTLGTPDTSARATPIDEEPRLRMMDITRAGPTGTWQAPAPKTDPVPKTKVLANQQVAVGSADDSESTQGSEAEPSPLNKTFSLLAVQGSGSGEKKKRTRTPQACEACRKRKAKCTGGQPCGRCTTKHLTCIFADIRPKVPPLTTTHHRATASSSHPPHSQQPKRRRHSDNTRYNNEPIVKSESALSMSPVVEAAHAQSHTAQEKNFLQLQLNGAAIQPQSWPVQGWPAYPMSAYGYTGTYDPAGLAALGFQQPMGMSASYSAPSTYTQTPYSSGHNLYNDVPLNLAAPTSSTPSASNNSSPSYGEVSLCSPYDFNMIGQATADSYFPTTDA